MPTGAGATECGALKGNQIMKRVQPVWKRISTFMPAAILMFTMQLFGQTFGPRPAGNPDTSVAHGEQPQMESSEGPTSIRYKGLSLTPGGFLEGAFVFRTR